MKGLFVLFLALVVSACGGSNGPQSRAPDFLQGTLLDSPVAGVSYSTATQSGTTDSNGTFRYRAGERVTFTLGDLTLGSADGTTRVTLFDLAAVAPPDDLKRFWEDLRVTTGVAGPLHKAINLGVLLQSLDSDNDPDNGIDIPAAAAALLDPADIDLGMSYSDFQSGGNPWDGEGLTGLLRRAADAGALSARAPVTAGQALTHMLAQLDSPGYPVARRYTQDQDMDGTIDYLSQSEYDQQGRYVREYADTDGDGLNDWDVALTYDATGKQVRRSRDNDADGNPDSVTITQYNDFGQITRREVTAGGVTTQLEVWNYDADGRLIRRERDVPNAHTIEHWIVDEDGIRSIQEYDRDADGNVDLRNVLTYGELKRSDQWIVRDIDNGLDGTFDGRHTRSFDEFGRVLTSHLDSDLDGTLDQVFEWDYGVHGVTRQHVARADGNGYTYHYQYNDQGLLSEFAADQDLDGVIDRYTYYVYDAQGNRIEQNSDWDADGNIDNRHTNTFDAQGKQLSWESDQDGDGVPNTRETFTYDEQGRRVRSDYDRGADGTTDVLSEWSDWVRLPFGSTL